MEVKVSHHRGSESDWSDVLKIISASAKLIALIILGVWWLIEFHINPHNNSDFYMSAGKTYQIQGIECRGDDQDWFIQINAIERSGKYYKAKVTHWIETDLGKLHEAELELYNHNELKFSGCADGEVEVALIWQIDSKKGVHLRIHPPFRIPQ